MRVWELVRIEYDSAVLVLFEIWRVTLIRVTWSSDVMWCFGNKCWWVSGDFWYWYKCYESLSVCDSCSQSVERFVMLVMLLIILCEGYYSLLWCKMYKLYVVKVLESNLVCWRRRVIVKSQLTILIFNTIWFWGWKLICLSFLYLMFYEVWYIQPIQNTCYFVVPLCLYGGGEM